MDHIDWNRGLLLGCLLVTIGGMATVAGRSVRDRLLAMGVLVQGIAIVFVAGGGYLFREEFDLASAALLLVFCLWGIWMIPIAKRSVQETQPDSTASAEESQAHE
jgi:FtsH-binding integral membrane protein